jgi:hypothetical protein
MKLFLSVNSVLIDQCIPEAVHRFSYDWTLCTPIHKADATWRGRCKGLGGLLRELAYAQIGVAAVLQRAAKWIPIRPCPYPMP